jgi:hypothetical protein
MVKSIDTIVLPGSLQLHHDEVDVGQWISGIIMPLHISFDHIH